MNRHITTIALLVLSLCFSTQGFSQVDSIDTEQYDWDGYLYENPTSGEIIQCGTTETTDNASTGRTSSYLLILPYLKTKHELRIISNTGILLHTDTIQGIINLWIPIEDPSVDECTVTIKDLEWGLETSW